MNQLGGFPLLTLVVFLPMLGSVVILLIPQERREGRQWLTLLIAATDLFVVLFLYMGWIQSPLGTLQFVDGPWPWIARWGIYYHLGIDGISLHLVLLTSLLTTIVLIQEWVSRPTSDGSRKRSFWILILETGLLGALTAFDWILLSMFWLMAFVAAFFVLGYGAQTTRPASRLAVAGAIVAAALLSVTVGLSGQSTTFDLIDLFNAGLDLQQQTWMFWAVLVACWITAALFPLHLWYAATERDAPPGSRLLVGVLLRNLGIYGLIRLCLQIFALSAMGLSNVLAVLGTIGLLYGALATLAPRTLSASLAYWNLAQMGWVTIGIFSLQSLGLHGALFHTMACSVATAIMLLLGPTQDPRPTQPPAKWGQRFAWGIGALSAIGVPGLAGFVGNSTLVLGFVQARWQDPTADLGRDVWSIAIAVGLVLAAWGLFRAWRSVQTADDVQQALIVVPLVILLVLAGLRPTLITNIVGPSVHRLLTQVFLSARIPTDGPDPAAPQTEGEEQFFPLPDRPDGARLQRDRQPARSLQAARATSGLSLPALERYWVDST